MNYYIVLLILSYISLSIALAADDTAHVKTLPFSCNAVKPFFEAHGFLAKDISNEPVPLKDLKICSGLSNKSMSCCSSSMESHLQTSIREEHDRATKDTLERFQSILGHRAIRFNDFFNNLLKTSKKSFHKMFKKTYGILYEQNAYVFIDLFQELEKYYTNGLVDLDDVMDTFFNTLYQKMFTVLNSQYKFDNKYLQCVSHHMKDMRPFGDVPQKLSIQIKRSFIATRAFSQSLHVAIEVLKNMQQLKSSNECAAALTRMSACPACSGIPGRILACNDMCENIMKGCLAQYAALDADWNHFVEAVDKVADRLLGPFNIEMLVRPINLKISEAIMNFQESSHDVSQRVFTGCGRPILGRRRRNATVRNGKEINKQTFLNFDEEKIFFVDEKEERSSSAIILDKLVKEIKQRIRDSRQFWLYLPYKLCNNGLVVSPSNTNNCWNGTHVDKYMHPPASNGEMQKLNPEVSVIGSRVSIVREQIFALNSISNRLRLAYNGHDVDWIDTEENWSSGSGSGDGSSDSITDDEDDFTGDGSGYETTVKPIKYVNQTVNKLKERQETLSTTLPSTRVEIIDIKSDKKLNFNVNLIHNNIDGKNSSQSAVAGSANTIYVLSSRSFCIDFLSIIIIYSIYYNKYLSRSL